MKVELIAGVCRDLDLDELDFCMKLECLKLDSLDSELVKSPISNMNCENNYMDNKSESHKNRGKRGCKEQTMKIKSS